MIFEESDIVKIVNRCRGHQFHFSGIFKNGMPEAVFSDNGELLNQPRSCKKCGRNSVEKEYDACLGKIPGVKAACCGHGYDDGYILWNDGVCCRWDKNGIPLRSIDFYWEDPKSSIISYFIHHHLIMIRGGKNFSKFYETIKERNSRRVWPCELVNILVLTHMRH